QAVQRRLAEAELQALDVMPHRVIAQLESSRDFPAGAVCHQEGQDVALSRRQALEVGRPSPGSRAGLPRPPAQARVLDRGGHAAGELLQDGFVRPLNSQGALLATASVPSITSRVASGTMRTPRVRLRRAISRTTGR